MEQFVFNFDTPSQNNEFAHGCRLFYIDTIVNRDARLHMCDVDKSAAEILAQFLELIGALSRCTGWPGFDAPKNDYDHHRDDERDQGECERPGDASGNC